jgi:exosortase C (VPDSG-CTERM-specific)
MSPNLALNPSAPRTVSRLKLFGWIALLICLAFGQPLLAWLRLGLSSELQSAMLLVPFISVGLAWMKRRELPATCESAPAVGVMLMALGLVALSAERWGGTAGKPTEPTDVLALRILALFLFLNGLAFQVLGMTILRRLAFPACFLFFMIPLPGFAVNALEVFFQHTSAEATAWYFGLTGSIYYREGLVFQLPGVQPLQVAKECSGIHSSYVLFLVSLVAGQLLLERRWHRILLVVFVVPLGILRNGFRIFTLGTLAVHYSPTVLDSPLHHQGGPIFFGLSLIPFLLLVIWLRRREGRRANGAVQGAG